MQPIPPITYITLPFTMDYFQLNSFVIKLLLITYFSKDTLGGELR